MKLLHVCEVCGKKEILTPEEAFEQGWDYPPNMGMFGVLSPRTCGDCVITDTIWWKLTQEHIKPEELSDKDKTSLKRIMLEPSSILVEE